ncbi:MAG: S41 family peptidase [Bryobacteraceae bacterium]
MTMLPVAFLLLLQAAANDLEQSIRTFSRVFAAVEANAADPVNPHLAIYENALPALLRTLDPHSVFLSPAQFEQLREMERSTTRGFGTIVSVLPGRVIVLQTIAGGPSARAGIAPGDEIVAVNGYRLDLLDMDQLVAVLGQTRQSQAQLYVRRPGTAKLLEFLLTPEELASPSVDRAWQIQPGVAYIRITSFEGETANQLQEALSRLGGASLAGLVLDLRNNGGGIVNSAIEIAGYFLKPGARILTARGRARAAEESTVPDKAVPYEFPIAVLINEKTASAAEIVSGALQDHDRATIVGTASFGKGLVQSVYPMSDGTAMALTTAFYFTPSGRSIQRPLREGQLGANARYAHLEQNEEFRTDSGRVVKGGGGIEPDIVIAPRGHTRLGAYLDASGILTAFATEFVRKQPGVDRSFTVSDALLDDLQVFLSERNVRPGLSEWSAERAWVRSRVHQEIFNLALGVAAGDEVESKRDEQVRRAVGALGVSPAKR